MLVRVAVTVVAVSVLSALPSLAVTVNVPADCGDASTPCSCVVNACSPNVSITGNQIVISGAGITFDCTANPSFTLGGTSGSPVADPIVDITGSAVTVQNCTVRYGSGRGIYAHNTQDITLMGNTISDTATEAVAAFQVGSSNGPTGNGIVLERNVISKTRNVASGPGDNAVGLYSLTAASRHTCNVISSESNGITNNGNSSLRTQCNAFMLYGTRYSPSASPIAAISEQGSGMHSESDCVVTFGDDTNPHAPTRCNADTTWVGSCSGLLGSTCLSPLNGFGAFSLAEGTYDHDEDDDGIVDWRDANHDGLADTDVFGIGSIGRNGNASDTTVEYALMLGVQRGLWAASTVGKTNHTVSFHHNRVVSIGSVNLAGAGVQVSSADGVVIQHETIVGTTFGIVTNDASHTGYPIEISHNTITSSLFWQEADSGGAIQLQRTAAGLVTDNKIFDNHVTAWKGYGIGLLGGSSGAGVSVSANTFTDVLGSVFDFEELPGSEWMAIEVADNVVEVVAPAQLFPQHGFYLNFTNASNLSTLSIHDNDVVAHMTFNVVGSHYASLRAFHNVFRPAALGSSQTSGTPGQYAITDTVSGTGNNWMTHCDATIPQVWVDVLAGTLSVADPHAYEGDDVDDRPWELGPPHDPGCSCPFGCDDGNECTDPSCDPATGCVQTNNAAPCDDGSFCTTGDTCDMGTCTGTPLDCDDGNACTADSCLGLSGCQHVDLSSDCLDGDACTTDSCDPAIGCVFTPVNNHVVGSQPEDDRQFVPLNTNVTLTYLYPINPATVNTTIVRLLDNNGVPVPATVAVSPDGTNVTLDPSQGLTVNTLYTVVVFPGVQDALGCTTVPYLGVFKTTPTPMGAEELPNGVQGGITQSRAGTSNASIGHLNSNSLFQGFASGAPEYTTTSGFATTSAVEAGAVLIYFGSASAAERGLPDIIFEGAQAHDRAGVSVAGDFDFNGDGWPDIVIGAEQVDRTTNPGSPTPTGNGKVYVIFFDPTDTVHYPHIADPAIPDVVSLSLVGQPGGIPGVVFTGAAFGDQAGFSVAAGGTSTPSGGDGHRHRRPRRGSRRKDRRGRGVRRLRQQRPGAFGDRFPGADLRRTSR